VATVKGDVEDLGLVVARMALAGLHRPVQRAAHRRAEGLLPEAGEVGRFLQLDFEVEQLLWRVAAGRVKGEIVSETHHVAGLRKGGQKKGAFRKTPFSCIKNQSTSN